MNADSHVHLGRVAVLVSGPYRVSNPQGGPDSSLGVVLVRGRCPEHRDRRVADELLDGGAEARECTSDERVEGRERIAHILDVHLLGSSGRSHEVGEEDTDMLSLLGDRLRRELSSARDAEPRLGGAFLAANGTNGHPYESKALERPSGARVDSPQATR